MEKKNPIGQINRETTLGDWIYEKVKQVDIVNVVEVGTWNGLGSTKCIIDAIQNSGKKEYLIISLETNKKMHKLARKNLPILPNFYLLHGKIVDSLIDINQLDDSYFRDFPREKKKTWYEEDKKNMKSVKNVFRDLPEKIDLLILDGGEFTSQIEFDLLKNRSKFIILDDTNDFCIKNRKSRDEVLKNPKNYRIIVDALKDRNGYLIAENLLYKK